MSKRILLSIGRKVLIAMLLAAAVLLSMESGYFHGIGKSTASDRSEQIGAAEQSSAKTAGTVLPVAAVVCLPDGGRFGALYNAETVTSVFHRFSAELGEALGSAGQPAEMTEQEFFTECLNGCGVFLRLYCPQPLELLTTWLGAEISGDAATHQAQVLFLRAAESEVELCYRTETGIYYRCSTAVAPDGVLSRTGEYIPNGAYFAFENQMLAACDGCTVILEGAAKVALLKYTVPMPAGDELNTLLETMGMNSFLASSYSEADGTVVFVDEESTLRLDPSGYLYYRRSVLPEENDMQSVTAAAGAAWHAAERSVGSNCGDAALVLTGITGSESRRSVTILLDYAVDGIPVRQPKGHAAEIVLRNNEIIQAQLNFRRYVRTEEQERMLPFLQANAIAAAGQANAELVYADSGDTINCFWVKTDG